MSYLSVLAIAVLLTLLFGSSQWKWCYLTQAYFLKHNDGKPLIVPENYSGVWKSWYHNGVLQAEDSYEGGKLEGQSKWYYESGFLKSRLNWQNNQLEGKWIQYYDSSAKQVEYEKNYQQGSEHGECSFYDQSSSLLKMTNVYQKGELLRQIVYRSGREHEIFDKASGRGDENLKVHWGLNE